MHNAGSPSRGEYPSLPNHPTQNALPVDGWRSVLFGLPFVMIPVIAILTMALKRVQVQKHAPAWLIGGIFVFFILAGAFFIVHGVRGVVHRAACRREAREQPGEIWISDYHWHREGIAYSAFNAMLLQLLAALTWYAFLIPFFWVGITKSDGPPIFLIFAGLFALFGLYFWWRWLQLLGGLLRYGNSFLSYESFPFFLGRDLNARLRAPKHIAALDQMTLTLRCVLEKPVTTGSVNHRSTKLVCFEIYKDVRVLSRDQLTGGDIPIKFSLPEAQQTTTLSSMPCIYWEVHAQGIATGADYEAYFLVPVYKR